MDRQFDLVVVGTGVTSSVASRCREAGWTVAVIDSRPFGGTCALRGCIPKKILVGAAEAVHHARDMTDIDAVTDLSEFHHRYREALVFLYVFADQLGVPLPAIPALLAWAHSRRPASCTSAQRCC